MVLQQAATSQPQRADVDVAVVGGGASGLAAGISAARAGASVCVIERDAAAGLPILATGNGRCNLSNARLAPARYRHPEAFASVAGEAPEAAVLAFFESLGLVVAEEAEGRLYPRTRSAQSVRDVLLDGCEREGVRLRCGCEPVRARYDSQSDAWCLVLSEPAAALRAKPGPSAQAALRNQRKALAAAPQVERPLTARRVIIACGGGVDRMAELFGLPLLEQEPVLCPIACEPATLGQGSISPSELDGLRATGVLTLLRDGSPIACEHGEVLFRPYGVSGIAAFNLSRRVQAGDSLELDLFPEFTESEFEQLLERREALLGPLGPCAPRWFDGLLAPALGAPVLRCVEGAARPLHVASGACKHLRFTVKGPAQPELAQARRGGIPLDALALDALAIDASLAPALHACGEALDMDADCGGFNLAWAWLSGLRAGAAAARSTREEHPHA